MLLAELEAYTSRPIAPTRRVALGRIDLPTDPAPGFGGILLAGVIARFAPDLDEDLREELGGLMSDVEAGFRIPQPRLRHRFQQDRIGLQPCSHRLFGEGEELRFEFEELKGTPAHQVLAAVYAAGQVPLGSRRRGVMEAMRRGLRWQGDFGPAFVAHVSGRTRGTSAFALRDPIAWALGVLGIAAGVGGRNGTPARQEIVRAFRDQLRAAHPDHGGEDAAAAARIAELTEARRILLG